MISKIELKNFKAFEDEEFKIAPLTLITGINGMGKSSIIQSLMLLKQSADVGYLENKKQVLLSGDLVNLESAEDMCYSMAETKDVIITLTSDNLSYSWTIDAKEPASSILPCSYEGNENWTELSLFSPDMIFLEAERLGPRISYNNKTQRAYNTVLGVQGELTPSYLNRAVSDNEIIGIESMKHPSLEEGANQLSENLNAWMSEIVSLPLKTRISEVDESTVKLRYNIQGSKGKTYSALQVGFGLSFSLPIIVALLRAKRNDLLIFENPEAHLHPSAQVELGKMIASAVKSGVQIIMESHSDHILNSVRLACKENLLTPEDVSVLFINYSADSFQSYSEEIKISSEGKLNTRPSNFFDSWDNLLTELI